MSIMDRDRDYGSHRVLAIIALSVQATELHIVFRVTLAKVLWVYVVRKEIGTISDGFICTLSEQDGTHLRYRFVII